MRRNRILLAVILLALVLLELYNIICDNSF